MAKAPEHNRPLSPHLSIYRPQITSVLSILNRITGVGLAFTTLLITCWLVAASSDAECFDSINGFLTSWFGDLLLLASTVAFWFHFCNGIRHLVWDAGYGFDMDQVTKSGRAAIILTAILTIITIIV